LASSKRGAPNPQWLTSELHREATRKVTALFKKVRRSDPENDAQEVIVRAVDQFDPAKGVPFVAYAMTIAGTFARRTERTFSELPEDHSQPAPSLDDGIDARRRLDEPETRRRLAQYVAREQHLGKRYYDPATLLPAVLEVAHAEHEESWGVSFASYGQIVLARWDEESWAPERRAREIWHDVRKVLREGKPVRVRREFRRCIQFVYETRDPLGAHIAALLRAIVSTPAGVAPHMEDLSWIAANLPSLRLWATALHERVPKDPRQDLIRPPSLDEWLREWDERFPFRRDRPNTDREMAIASILAGIVPEVARARFSAGVTVAMVVERATDAVTKARARIRS
jgi:hypothetical protein